MLPSSGYFRDIPCPYLKSGLCERAQCHYKHDFVGVMKMKPDRHRSQSTHCVVSNVASVAAYSSENATNIPQYNTTSSLPDYVPTPLAKLKGIKVESKKDALHVSFVPEYKPTPISELKKRQEESESAKSDDSDESKKTVSKEKHRNTKKDGKIEKTKTKRLKQEKIKKEIVIDDEDQVQVISSGKRKPSEADPADVESASVDASSKKKRIAHQSEIPSLQLPTKKSRLSLEQTMQQRLIEAQERKEKQNKQAQISSSSTRVAHTPKIKAESDSSTKNGKERVAHIPKSTPSKRPVISTLSGKKIPIKIRQQYLDKLIDELLVFCDEKEAFSRGLEYEKSAYDRCTTKPIYSSLSANFVKKIREEAIERKSADKSKSSPAKINISEGNKAISHEMILNGRISGTISIVKRAKALTEKDLSDVELYEMLSKYVMKESTMREYGVPRADPYNKGSAILPIIQTRSQKNNYDSQIRTCSRCQKTYTVSDEDGLPVKYEACVFHQGRLWNERFNKSIEKKYSCCKNPPGSPGCDSNKYHVIDGYDHPDYSKNYARILPKKPPPANKFFGIYALDCEMCYTTIGLELTRVTVMNVHEEVVYETLVKPAHPILDYNTRFSGLKKGDLDKVTTTIDQVHRRLLSLFNDKTILIGHSIDSDLRALKLIHDTVVDTSQVFPHKRGLPFRRALRNLTAEYLKTIIQDDAGHDSKEDAAAALRMMLWRVREDLKKLQR